MNEKPSESKKEVIDKSTENVQCELSVPYLRPRKSSVLRQQSANPKMYRQRQQAKLIKSTVESQDTTKATP